MHKIKQKQTLHIVYLHIVEMFHSLTLIPSYLFSNCKNGQILPLFFDWFLPNKLPPGFIFIFHEFSKLLIISVILFLILFCILEDKENETSWKRTSCPWILPAKLIVTKFLDEINWHTLERNSWVLFEWGIVNLPFPIPIPIPHHSL